MASGKTGYSAANITSHLSGIDFPCNRQAVLDFAEQNGAPDDVLEALEKLPKREFRSMADLMQAYGEAV